MTPACASPAFRNGDVNNLILCIIYNIVPNIANMPAG